MKNKNTKIYIVLLVIILIIAGFFSVYLRPIMSFINDDPEKLPIEYIQFDREINNCTERNLDNRIVLITSRYCPHCKEAVSLLLPMIKQYNLEAYFKIIDVINNKDRNILRRTHNISASYVPILIINCQAYLGTKSAEQYRELLNAFSAKITMKTNGQH